MADRILRARGGEHNRDFVPCRLVCTVGSNVYTVACSFPTATSIRLRDMEFCAKGAIVYQRYRRLAIIKTIWGKQEMV